MSFKNGNPGCNNCCANCTAQNLTVAVKSCTGTTTGGASVSITGPSGYSASGTTATSGFSFGSYTTTWTNTGTYTITVTSGALSTTVSYNFASCAAQNITICLGYSGASSTFQLSGTIYGQCGAIFNALGFTVNVGSTAYNFTTSGTGTYNVCVPWVNGQAVTLAVTSPPTRHAAGSVSVGTCGSTITACSAVSKSLVLAPASGYACLCSFPTPAPTTLHMSNSWATATLTYGGSDWEGVGNANFPNCPPCQAVNMSGTWYLGSYSPGNCANGILVLSQHPSGGGGVPCPGTVTYPAGTPTDIENQATSNYTGSYPSFPTPINFTIPATGNCYDYGATTITE